MLGDVLDTKSELILISREKNVIMGSPVRVQAYGDQIINGDWAKVQLYSGPSVLFLSRIRHFR